MKLAHLLIFILALLLFYILYSLFLWFRILIHAFLALLLLYLFFLFFVKRYGQHERAIIYRLGKFHRIAGPGWAIVIPFFEEEFARLDIRTRMMNINVPVAFTKDDLRLELDGFAYYRILNPKKAVLEVENYQSAIQGLLISGTRDAIGSLAMREVFANLAKLNELVRDRVRRTAWEWGIDIPSVQIRRVTPPIEIAEAMQAKVIEAEMLQARRLLAEARKVAIEAIGEAAKELDHRALLYFYIKAIEKLAVGKAVKIIFPMRFIDVLEQIGKQLGEKVAGMKVDEIIDKFAQVISKAEIK